MAESDEKKSNTVEVGGKSFQVRPPVLYQNAFIGTALGELGAVFSFLRGGGSAGEVTGVLVKCLPALTELAAAFLFNPVNRKIVGCMSEGDDDDADAVAEKQGADFVKFRRWIENNADWDTLYEVFKAVKGNAVVAEAFGGVMGVKRWFEGQAQGFASGIVGAAVGALSKPLEGTLGKVMDFVERVFGEDEIEGEEDPGDLKDKPDGDADDNHGVSVLEVEEKEHDGDDDEPAESDAVAESSAEAGEPAPEVSADG